MQDQNLTKPDIAAAIEKAMAERAERTRLTADWVVDELRKLAGANMDDCMKANPSGDPYLVGINARSDCGAPAQARGVGRPGPPPRSVRNQAPDRRRAGGKD